MKKIRTALAILAALCLLLAAAGSGAETYLDSNGEIPDRTVYHGDWQSVYLRVLEEHSREIHAYQAVPFEWDGEDSRLLPCFPVSLKDLNDDGIPELFFLEADGNRVDMYIYSGNGSTGKCALYVPGIRRLDYDAALGFEIYLLPGHLLTIQHYRYEDEYLLQFYAGGQGPYGLLDSAYNRVDASGEGDGWYYLNGREISHDAYYRIRDIWNADGECISKYFAKNEMSYGLDYTYETAVSVLGGTTRQTAAPTMAPTMAPTAAPAARTGVYGYTIDKLATRKGPGTQYEEGGTYFVKNQWIKVLAKAYDRRNKIWWVKCEIPYKNEIRTLWTGYQRFDETTLNLNDLPEETW